MKIPYDFFAKTIVLMVGLPYSGKSTAALRISSQIGAPIVSPDALRVALSGERFLAPLEPHVWVTARIMVRALFLAGHDIVILDATNTTRKRRDEWRTSEGWNLLFHHIDTPVDTCLNRAARAGDLEIEAVIQRMHDQFEPLEDDEDKSPWV